MGQGERCAEISSKKTYRWPKVYKNALSYWSSGKWKSETTVRYYLTNDPGTHKKINPSGMNNGVKGPSFTAAGTVDWSSHFEKQFGTPQSRNFKFPYDPTILLLVIYLKNQKQNITKTKQTKQTKIHPSLQERHLHFYIHCSTSHNSQNLKTYCVQE